MVYSVTGGFTPLPWKFLGDELVLRLKKSDTGSELQGMDRMREAAEAEMRGQTDLAESQYRLAMNLLPGSAAPPYRWRVFWSGPENRKTAVGFTARPSSWMAPTRGPTAAPDSIAWRVANSPPPSGSFAIPES